MILVLYSCMITIILCIESILDYGYDLCRMDTPLMKSCCVGHMSNVFLRIFLSVCCVHVVVTVFVQHGI